MSSDVRFGSSTKIESSPFLKSADHVMGHLVPPFDGDPRVARKLEFTPRCSPVSVFRETLYSEFVEVPLQSVAWEEHARIVHAAGISGGVQPRGQPKDGADEIRKLAETRTVLTNPVACGVRSKALRMSLDERRRG